MPHCQAQQISPCAALSGLLLREGRKGKWREGKGREEKGRKGECPPGPKSW